MKFLPVFLFHLVIFSEVTFGFVCKSGDSPSITKIHLNSFYLAFSYCHHKTSDVTEIIQPLNAVFRPLHAKNSVRMNYSNLQKNLRVRTFLGNRCDWMEVNKGSQKYLVSIGRWSQNCRTSYFSTWRLRRSPRMFEVPVAFRKANNHEWQFFLAKQEW